MRIIDCTLEHADTVLAILNDAIINSTALYDYVPRTPEMIANWFESKRIGNLPIIGAIDDANQLLGFATYGPFRNFPAYKYTVEHSLYITSSLRGKGIGTLLMRELIDRAVQQQLHVLVGAIDSSNAPSIALHEKFGFRLVGTMPQVGFKFRRWLDLCFYQLMLPTPTEPRDG